MARRRQRRPFVPLDRGLMESDLYRGWSPMQRTVAAEFYALMRITPGPSRHGYMLARGEFDHSLRFIARRVPGCTKDVVEGVANALRRAGYLSTRKPTGAPTRAIVRKLACFADLAESEAVVADSIDDSAGDEPPTDDRQVADESPTQETDADPDPYREQQREDLFRGLFVACPEWNPIRQRLTTSEAQALDGEALKLCGDLISRALPPGPERVETYKREALALMDSYRGNARRIA